MTIAKFLNLKTIIATTLLLSLMSPGIYANSLEEIDVTRAYLTNIKDKDSQYYQKTRLKLLKLINKHKIDYSDTARYDDIKRLIDEKKYDSAIYELNELISKGYRTSKCYEILGDISDETDEPARKTANFYKLALQEDNTNTQASIKLASLYFREKKNIMGAEYLKQTIENTNDTLSLKELEKLIKTTITPKNKFEANIIYESLGMVYEKLGMTKEAYESYYKALQINPKDIYLRYHLANFLYDKDVNKYAIYLLGTILDENPKDSQIRASMAKTLAKEGNLLSADREFKEILENNPDSIQAKYGIYSVYYGKLSPDKILKKIHASNPDYQASVKDLLDFSKFLNKLGETEGAMAFEACAIKLKEEEKLQKEIERNNKIAEEEKQKQEKLAIKNNQKSKIKKQSLKNEVHKDDLLLKPQIKKEIAQAPATPTKQSKTKKQTTKTKKKTPEVQKQTEKTQPIEQQKKVVQKQANQTTQNQTTQKQANQTTQKQATQTKKETVAQKQPQKNSQNNKNINKETSQKKTMASQIKNTELETNAQKYLAMKPQTAQTLTAAANCFKQLNNHANALKYYTQARKLDPTNSDIYYNLGLTYLEINKLEEAKTNLTKSINLDDKNLKARNLLAFVNQKIITQILNNAYEQYENKEYVKAFEILDEGIKEYPKIAQLYYYRAIIYAAMNRNAASIIDLQKATELSPGHYMAYYQLGKIYEKIKDERSALVAYERFLSIEPDEKQLIEEVQNKVTALGAKYY